MKDRENLLRNRPLIFAGLLLAGILLRGEYLREFASSPLFDLALGADVSEYHARASDILMRGFLAPVYEIHAPLYSWFLALAYWITGHAIPLVRGIQLLINLLAWSGFYFFLRKRCRYSDWTPEWMFAGAMVFLPAVFFQAELLSESLLLPLLLGAVSCVMALDDRENEDRKSRSLAGSAGLLTGLAVITHPITLLYFCFQAFDFLRRSKGPRFFIYCALALLVILPVSWIRSARAGRFVLVQNNSALNLYIGNHEQADGTCCIRPGIAWKELHRNAEEEARCSGTTKDAVFFRKVLQFAAAHPLQMLQRMGRKILQVWAPQNLPAGADASPIFGWTLLMRFGGPFTGAVILLLGLAGLWPVLREWESREEYRALLVLFAGFYLAQILFVTSGRYRLPMLPALLVFGGCFLQWMPAHRRQAIPAAAAAALVIAAGGLISPRLNAEPECRTLFAEALLQKKKPEKVLELLEGKMKEAADPARDLCIAGLACRQQGNDSRAIRYFRAAADASPQEAEALMDLAILYSDRRQYSMSEACFSAALKRDRDHTDVLFNYALMLEKRRHFRRESEILERLLKLEPRHPQGWNTLGRLAFYQHDLDKAEDCFERALELCPRNSGFRKNLELVRRKQKLMKQPSLAL